MATRFHVVIQPAFLGDLILAIPLIRRLKAISGGHDLAVVCRAGFGDLVRREAVVAEVIEIDKKPSAIGPSTRSALEALRRMPLDRVYCPHPSPRSAWLAFQSRATGGRIGFKSWWNRWAFSSRVTGRAGLPDAPRQMSLLTGEDAEIRGILENLTPGLKNSSETSEVVRFGGTEIPDLLRIAPRRRTRLRSGQILIAPGSQWRTKQWHAEGFAQVARSLRGRGKRVVWIGHATELSLCKHIARLSGGEDDPVCAGTWSLVDTVAAMRESEIVIGNDSGAIHLAALSGTPVVAVFGPTVLAQGFRPWLEDAAVVQTGLMCRPCGRHGHARCPIGTHACMQNITAHQVLAEVTRLLEP